MRTRFFLALVGIVVCVVALGAVVGQRLLAQDRPNVDREVIRSIVRIGGGQIGASVRDVTQADATAAKLTTPSGAFIQDVTAGGPAAAAGLRTGDVVMSFDGERVRSASHLVRLVGETAEGRAVDVVVQRAGQSLTVKVTPEQSRAARVFGPRGLEGLQGLEGLEDRLAEIPRMIVPDIRLGAGRLGVTVQELTPQLATYFGVSDGVLVTSVTSGSAAGNAGLKAGDVITRVDGTAVETAAALRRRVSAASSEVTLTVTRDRKELSLKVAVTASRGTARTTT